LTNPNKYQSIQSIVQCEVNENVTQVKNSATDALMWLCRAVWFIREFIHEFSKSVNPEMGNCVYFAYQNTLKQYHNWVVRSIFSLAMRSLPTKDDFLKGLATKPEDYLNNKTLFEKQIVEEMKKTLTSIDSLLNAIRYFYRERKLEV
jgi:pleckstrin family protein A (phosphoinositide binding specific) protein 8